jgi:hypothetical protein
MNRLREGTVPEGSEVHSRTVPRGGKVQQKRTTGAGLLEEKAKKEEDNS